MMVLLARRRWWTEFFWLWCSMSDRLFVHGRRAVEGKLERAPLESEKRLRAIFCKL